MTGPADRSQHAEPGATTDTQRNFLYSLSGRAEAADTWTADAAYPADSSVPYTLTARAETLLGEAGSPTLPSPNAHARGMGTRPSQARPGLSGQARIYVTEISVPPSDSGIQRLHARMKDPEPEPEAG